MLMKLGIIGVGLAGGRIADAMLSYGRDTEAEFVSGVVTVNTAESDLQALKLVPPERRILLGAAEVKGRGTGSDTELGATIAREDVGEVLTAVGEIPVERTDAFLVVGGLAGGTGGGVSPVVADRLGRVYQEPVYGLGVLPSRDEGGIAQLNTARSFGHFYDAVENLLLLDNDAWRQPTGGSVSEAHHSINEAIARRLGVLLTASEAPSGVAPEVVVDASEIINTLEGGGVSAIGYATTTVEPEDDRSVVERVLDRVAGHPGPTFEGDPVNVIASTVRRAALGRLTVPCEVRGARRVLLVVAGPPELLSRRGIERGVDWLEDRTGTFEVRDGDYPLPGESKLAVLVVFSGVQEVPRLKEIHEAAVKTQRNIETLRESDPETFAEYDIPDEGELELPRGFEE
jgi:cell division GTPase FtsZ